MSKSVLNVAAILTVLLSVLLTERPETSAHDISAHPHTPDAIPSLALLPEQAKQLLLAIDVLSMKQQEAKDVNVKSSVLCFCLSKAGDTIKELRRLQAEWFNIGIASFKAHKYAEAVTAFTRVIKMNPRNAVGHTSRGLSHANNGNYQQAWRDFTQAIALNHHQAEAYYARGLIALIIDDVPRARLDLQKAAHLSYAPAQQLLTQTQERHTRKIFRPAVPGLSAPESP